MNNTKIVQNELLEQLQAFNMSNLYTQEGDHDTPSHVEEGAAHVASIGRPPRSRNPLYPSVDTIRAVRDNVVWSATTNFTMTRAAAGKMMGAIFGSAGVEHESDGFKYAFVRGMCLCLALNSSSVRMPDRAVFTVAGVSYNLFEVVVSVTGNDTRRFFRAYADETRSVLRQLRARARTAPENDTDEALDAWEFDKEQWNYVEQVAAKRGLSRTPLLIHDSASACSGLTHGDRVYLDASVRTIFADNPNWNSLDNPKPARVGGESREGAVSGGSGGDLGDNY
jgi:hypothetical protein